jgi:hypothetical protein
VLPCKTAWQDATFYCVLLSIKQADASLSLAIILVLPLLHATCRIERDSIVKVLRQQVSQCLLPSGIAASSS